MAKQIRSWEELVGLESENYKLDVKLYPGGGGCAHIRPKVEIAGEYDSVYLSTHTFYESHYRWATKTLQEHGFDVELIKDA